MALINSSTSDEGDPTGRPKVLQRKEGMLFGPQEIGEYVEQRSWTRNEDHIANERPGRRYSRDSVGSNRSSDATREASRSPAPAGHSSIAKDDIPVHSTPPPPPTRTQLDSTISMPFCNFPGINMPYPTADTLHATATRHISSNHSTLTSEELQTPAADVHVYHSKELDEQFLKDSLPLQIGPMENFLAEDDLVELDPIQITVNKRKLRSLRVNLFRLRAEHRTKREELNQKEKLKNATDQEFMNLVRKIAISSAPSPLPLPISEIQSRFDAMQDARNEYGPLEYECNKLEDLVDQAQVEVDKLESRSYRPVSPHVEDLSKADVHRSDDSDPASQSLLGISSDAKEEYHPLHAKLLSRLGDLDLATERYYNMRHEGEVLLSEKQTRTRLNLSFDEDKEIFLRELPAQENNLADEMARLNAEIEELKIECEREGIDIAESSFGSIDESFYDNDLENGHQDVNEEVAEQESQPPLRGEYDHSMFPVLFPKSAEDKAKLEILNTEFDEGNKSDRINRWLLYRLQTSPLDLDLIVKVLFRFVHSLDLRNLSEHIMYFWQLDEANKPPAYFKAGRTRSFSTQYSTEYRPISGVEGSRSQHLSWPRSLHKAKSAPSVFP